MKHKLFNLFSLVAILALLVPAGGMPVTAQEPSVAEAASAPIEIYRNTTTTPNTPTLPAKSAPAAPLVSVSGTNVPLAGTSAQAIDTARAGSLSSSGTFTVYLPLIQSSQPPITPVIPATTQVLTGTLAANLVAVAVDTSVLTFTQPLTQPLSLTPGDVIVSAPSAAAPNGLLRRVLTVTTASGQTVVQTTAAALENAMQQGEAHVSQALTPSQIQSARYSEGVALVRRSPAAQDATFYLEIKDVVLYDDDGNPATTNDQVLANGSIEVEPTLNFDFRLVTTQA
jgi:hypothetical protein